ncbi:hypothetical protein [Vibrio neptunius]|uniref:Uncharacterized protein n=1 Tax=Vibrio neptunius TaxID=170651 RepID=A0ABS3A7U5_9VIBR|nr:hypothetical protein [Vibrio neptunius]MBN3495726.1 hypothetical protein [Vibrio neptunius]MBN3518150.1 hypothetical protein [Vibrio neptunius]MBN3552507.1 hypothetical protein [Vibrio neptunius]MBN3580547.1 hypothetical protein [Vibrio neptunius]MCH9874214.1 hypothetical protein [Vibrio neptunius]
MLTAQPNKARDIKLVNRLKGLIMSPWYAVYRITVTDHKHIIEHKVDLKFSALLLDPGVTLARKKPSLPDHLHPPFHTTQTDPQPELVQHPSGSPALPHQVMVFTPQWGKLILAKLIANTL